MPTHSVAMCDKYKLRGYGDLKYVGGRPSLKSRRVVPCLVCLHLKICNRYKGLGEVKMASDLKPSYALVSYLLNEIQMVAAAKRVVISGCIRLFGN